MNALAATLPVLRVHLEHFASSCRGLLRPVAAEGHPHPAPSHTLGPLETQWIDTQPGLQVTCLDGCLSLQFQGRPRDVILVRGESHACDSCARVAVHAFVATEMLLH